MSAIDKDLAIQTAIEGRVEVLRAYAGTDLFAQLIGLLDALKSSYMEDMAYVSPADLQIKQGALRQVMALMSAIDGPTATLPRV